MSRRRSLIRARIVATACALAAAGCSSSGPPPVSPAEPAEVVCDVCGKVVARQGAKPHISLEGLDVYTCPRCVAKARQLRPPPHPPTRRPT